MLPSRSTWIVPETMEFLAGASPPPRTSGAGQHFTEKSLLSHSPALNTGGRSNSLAWHTGPFKSYPRSPSYSQPPAAQPHTFLLLPSPWDAARCSHVIQLITRRKFQEQIKWRLLSVACCVSHTYLPFLSSVLP